MSMAHSKKPATSQHLKVRNPWEGQMSCFLGKTLETRANEISAMSFPKLCCRFNAMSHIGAVRGQAVADAGHITAADCKQAASFASSFRTIRQRDTLMVCSLGWRTLPLRQAPRAVGKVVSRFKRLSHNRLGIAHGVFATHTDPWK